MFSSDSASLKLANYRFGNPTCNLEHRRVNVASRKTSGLLRAAD
jgi:hypothetical protein